MLIDQIKSPHDLKKLTRDELKTLAKQIPLVCFKGCDGLHFWLRLSFAGRKPDEFGQDHNETH